MAGCFLYGSALLLWIKMLFIGFLPCNRVYYMHILPNISVIALLLSIQVSVHFFQGSKYWFWLGYTNYLCTFWKVLYMQIYFQSINGFYFLIWHIFVTSNTNLVDTPFYFKHYLFSLSICTPRKPRHIFFNKFSQLCRWWRICTHSISCYSSYRKLHKMLTMQII